MDLCDATISGDMSNSIARKPLPSYREYGQQLMPITPVDTKGGSARIAHPRRIARPSSLEGSPHQRFGRSAFFGSDPSLIVPVIASPEDIRRAQELRLEIKKRYLDRLDQPSPYWSIDVD